MSNPFDDENGIFFVLVNHENQHSLWPAGLEVPAGWTVVHDRDSRDACIAYVEEHWKDLRPASLIAAQSLSS
jgi:MbtH protein